MVKYFTSGILSILAFFCGQTNSARPPSQHGRRAPQRNVPQKILDDQFGIVDPMVAAPPRGSPLPRSTWSIVCDGQQSATCSSTIDGKGQTFWQNAPPDTKSHTFTIDLKTLQNVNAIQMDPASNDFALKGHRVYVSNNVPSAADLGELVAYGTWYADDQAKYAIFETRQVRYVTLQSVVDPGASPSSFSVRNLNVWIDTQYVEPPKGVGKWGPTIDFPVVPAGAWVDPKSGTVITFSSFSHDGFGQDAKQGFTLTATWDKSKQAVTDRRVYETGHDMFCPGMSFDVDGSMIITGGETADKVSAYNETTGTWKELPPMKIPRGYQGQTTCANGRIFVIGGSWGPRHEDAEWGGRTGEIYDPIKGEWKLLTGCPPDDVQTTQDWGKAYRYDNHIWLLGWKNNFVFQPGPSRQMNWINTTYPGEIKSAGNRATTTVVDNDAMCGSAAMYDAAEGLILAAGGAPSYKYWDDDGGNRGNGGCYIPGTGDSNTVTECRKPSPKQVASDNSFIIKLGEPNKDVSVSPAGGGHMHYSRIFHHAVILPDGKTFVVGGQQLGQGFTDQTPRLIPEMFTPSSSGGSWNDMAPHSIVRVYHSFALLLPDATVLVGGGGLCGGCNVNHFDAQIYTPQYLLTGNNRPVIKTIDPITALYPGSTITITTDRQVSTASLIRYGGATHSLNNDQRRIPFTLNTNSTSAPYSYKLTINPDGGIAIPGYWMLFVVDSNGVPSVAQTVQILVAK